MCAGGTFKRWAAPFRQVGDLSSKRPGPGPLVIPTALLSWPGLPLGGQVEVLGFFASLIEKGTSFAGYSSDTLRAPLI
eukprot:3337511-Amphidinium_carterae.1